MSEKSLPVGHAVDVKGHAIVTHADGTQETLTQNAPVYQDDVIETDASGAVNITFKDNTVFAVSNDAKMTIDEFVYDPTKHGEGEADISVLRGVFVYTSGLVGKEDHNDVHIKTPVGSIGIRGTTLTGYIPEEGSGESPQISLIEGAIVVQPNQGREILLDESRETVQLNSSGTQAENIGIIPPEQIIERFNVVRSVAPTLFEPVTQFYNSSANAPESQNAVTAPSPDASTSPINESVEQDASTAENQAQTQDATLPTSSEEAKEAGETQENSSASTEPSSESANTESQPQPPATQTSLGGEQRILGPQVQGNFIQGQNGLLPAIGPNPNIANPMAGQPNGQPINPMAGGEGHPINPPNPAFGNGFTTGNVIGGTPPVFYNPKNLAPIAKTQSFFAFEQAGLEGQIQSFDAIRFYSDPNGHAMTLKVTNIADPNAVLENVGINAANQLAFQVKDSITQDAVVHIHVAATDGRLLSDSVDYSFNIYNYNAGTFSPTITNDTISITAGQNGLRFSALAGDDTITIRGNNNIVFGGAGADTITIKTDNNKAFGGIGTDTILIEGGVSGTEVSGGNGNDSIFVQSVSAGNVVFGGDGDDTIALPSPYALMSSTAGTTQGNLLIDAGSGFDTLLLTNGGLLDLRAVPQGGLHSLERISSNSKSTTTIILDIEDIMHHSDTGFLCIQNAGDVQVKNTHGLKNLERTAENVTNPLDSTDTTIYTAYSNGVQTLYVDSATMVTLQVGGAGV